MKFPLAIALISSIAGMAQAQYVHWTGAVDSNWDNPGNWVERVPTPADAVIIPPGNTPLLQGFREVLSLEIQEGARMVLLGHLRVSNVVLISGSMSIAGPGSQLTHRRNAYLQGGLLTMWDGAMIQRTADATGNFYVDLGGRIEIPTYDTLGVTLGTRMLVNDGDILHSSTNALKIGPSSANVSAATSISIQPLGRLNITRGGDIAKTSFATSSSPFLVNDGTINVSGTITDVVDISSEVAFGSGGTVNVAGPDMYIRNSLNIGTDQSLTQGRWNCSQFGRLFFVGSPAIRSIGPNALITLTDYGSTISPLDQISENFGDMQILSGATLLVTPSSGVFRNQGRLTLGVGSYLAAFGAFNNEPAGTLTCGIAGTQDGQIGRVVALSASLRGTLVGRVSSLYSPAFPDKITLVQTPITPFQRFSSVQVVSTQVPFAALYENIGMSLLAGSCNADFNHDGTVDFFDYLDFVGAFSSGAADADFNYDFSIDFFDYLDFVSAFSAGC